MKALVAVVLLLCSPPVVQVHGKVFQRCKWARLLKENGMDGYHGVSLADWVCLTKHGSRFNTEASRPNLEGFRDLGILQLNGYYWCADGGITGNGCGVICSDLLGDDPAPSINCAQRVVRGSEGLRNWPAWTRHCEGRDLSKYLKGCKFNRP